MRCLIMKIIVVAALGKKVKDIKRMNKGNHIKEEKKK